TGDPRDGRETSFSSDEDGEGVQILTERQREKCPQFTQEVPVDRAQPPVIITREDIANLITDLKSTNETLQQQGLRITTLEESIRSKRSTSRSRSRSKTPPRRPDAHNRRPALERLQQPNKKRNRTPPREDRDSPSKKGKGTERLEQRRRSPQGLVFMAKQGPSSSKSQGNQGHQSPTPMRGNTSPRHPPPSSDEEDSRCPLSKEIMRAPIP
ncbi:hypothetical protein A2U01_0041065, partial [Trifolium medium]|nr:hypothetical protein [Trifolium medium]